MRIITFGPQGTFCHCLAQELTLDIELQPTLTTVCKALAESEDAYAILPLSNTLSGPVIESWLGIEAYGLEIIEEYERKITYCLVGATDPAHASILFVHPHAAKQCEHSLRSMCPNAKIHFTSSNVQSALELQQHPQNALALVSPKTATAHHLQIQKENMQDSEENKTRFGLIR